MGTDIAPLFDQRDAWFQTRTGSLADGDPVVMMCDQLSQAQRACEVGRPSSYEQDIHRKDLMVFTHESARTMARRAHLENQAVLLRLRRVGEMSSGASTTSISDSPS